MSNTFFSRFPVIDYNMDGQGSFLTLTNIVKNVDVNDLYSNDSTYYTYYDIIDGERPDTVSYKLYGNPAYYWSFFILNNDLRAGLNNAWPLSSQQFERMMANEYDRYSVITFMPAVNDVDSKGINGLVNLIYLWSEYLPYLRLTNANGTQWAKILKYDNKMLQLIVSDVEFSDGSGPVSSVTNFIESSFFKLGWSNPFDELSEAAEWAACEALKVDFIDRMISVYSVYDATAIIDPAILDELTTEEVIVAVAKYNYDYVFTKRFTPVGEKYHWESYRNAASEYYEVIDDVNYSSSAYDVVLNPAIIEPKYITYFEREELINSRKEKIRVIRKDRISDFVAAYFNTLNNGK